MSKEYDNIGECTVGELVRKAEQDYKGDTLISKHVTRNMLDTLNKIDAYHYSKHTEGGDKDSQGRDKPFPNIVTSAENIWYRATDIDRGKIKVKAVKSKSTMDAFLATVHVQDWMRKENFGIFLNEWGRMLARYCSAVVKFVEKEGELHRMVVPWQRIICDSVDFDNNPVIEVLELTEAQLRQRKGYDKEIVEKLCKAKATRKTIEGQPVDNKSDYIRLYEVHALLPLSYLTEKEKDEDTYVQQMHVISFVAGKEEGKFDDFTLISGKEEKSPYMLTHLIREEGQTLGIGPVEGLFEAQWMQNHSSKAIKDQLDLAGKLIFQTSDGTFVGQNALTAVENGDILIHAVNQPITTVANTAHDITSWQSFANQWKVLGNEITGVSESMLGNTAPSGTAWRQVETLLQESHDLFNLMRQNKGLYIEEMFKKFVIPFVKKQMDTSEEVSATLEDYDIQRIDAKYIKNRSTLITNNLIKDKVLSGQPVSPEEQAMMTEMAANGLKESLSDQGNQRFFKPSDIDTKTWKMQFKNLEWEVQVDVTGESTDQNDMTTLNTMLAFFARKQGMPLTPEEKLIFNKLLAHTGTVSPMELSALPAPVAQPSPLQANPMATPSAVGSQ
ncbi:MAG: hypothetical protein WC648_01205 [Candidatus Paceibacterota bacterium]|jgi:hypothetical protein